MSILSDAPGHAPVAAALCKPPSYLYMGQRYAGDRLHLGTIVETMDRWGDAAAVVEHRGIRRFTTSYRAIASRAHAFAAELESRGIGRGDRVLLWGANSAAWISAFFGCVLRGVLVVPLDAAGASAFAQRVANEVQPRLAVGSDDLLHRLPAETPRMSFEQMGALPPANSRNAVELNPETPLQILFTSGTTGTPKGVVHTHGNLMASLGPIEREAAKYRRYEKFVHPLRILHTLPLSHVFGQFMGLWIAPVLGATVHYEDRVAGTRLAADIAADRIHVLAAVPRTLDLLRAALCAADPRLEARVTATRGLPLWKRWWHLRRLHSRLGLRFWAAVCGGATLDPETELFWTTAGFAMIQGYGLTETAALVTLNHPFRTARGSLGAPLPGRSLRVNASGELEVKGDMVSTTSWLDGAVVRRADPWLATGDLAQIGSDGRVSFLGRTGQRLVTTAGLNVYLQDLESALAAQPGVREAIVVPCAGQAGAEEPVAVLVSSGDATAQMAAANAMLAPHQQMRRWWLWPGLALPRTASGKVARRQVQDWVAGQANTAAPREQSSDPVESLLASLGASRGPLRNDARLDEDWGLDSMGRVALAAALEEQAGVPVPDGTALRLQTVGDVRALLITSFRPAPAVPDNPAVARSGAMIPEAPAPQSLPDAVQAGEVLYSYPLWPWNPAVRLFRIAFIEVLLRPLVSLLAAPAVRSALPPAKGPLLLLSNHRTAMDVPLLLYALPPAVRRKTAVAMSGEMLTGWQKSWSRRPLPASMTHHRRWWGPVAAWLLRALLNVFPLPAGAGFRESFAHAGRALDRGYSILIFPEGRRASSSQLLPFKAGIGVLAGEAFVPVQPVALRICEGKSLRRRADVILGRAEPVPAAMPPEQETAHLQQMVRKLLEEN